MVPRFLSRLIISSGAVAACVAVVGYTLARPVPDEIDTPLARPSLGWPPYPLELTPAPSAEGNPKVLEASLYWADDSGWPGPPEVRLLVATFHTRPRLIRGVLKARDGACTYETPDGTAIEDNQYVTFRRQTACPPTDAPPVRSLDLTFAIEGEGRLGLWTYLSPAGSERKNLLLVHQGPASGDDMVPVVRGRSVVIRDRVAVTRIDLLNYVWGLSPSSGWIWWTLGLAGLLVALGIATLPHRPEQTPGAGFVVRTAAGMAAVGAGLGLLYAVLVPPLHSPDEPDHLLSYARLVHEESLPVSVAALARRGHLQRIRFRRVERFRPADMDAPYPDPWDSEVVVQTTEARSPAAMAEWRLIHLFAAGQPAASVLLAIRLSNVLLFVLCLGAGTALLVRVVRVPFPQLTPAVFLLVPALPFFAMHTSESALLASAYVLLACCLLALVLDGPRSDLVGLPLGLATGFAIAGGRSAVPLVAVIAAVLAGRVLFRDRTGTDRAAITRAAAVFWVGWLAGLSGLAFFSTEPYLHALADVASRVMPPDAVMPLAASGAAGLTLLAFLLEIRRGLRAERSEAGAHRVADVIARAGALLLAMLVIASLAGSLLLDYPHLALLEVVHDRTSLEYVREAVVAMATTLRLRSPELMLSSSFWAGFGWLDTIPPDGFFALVSLLTGTALVALLVILAVRGPRRLIARYALASAGLATSFVLYAWSAYLIQYDLAGRYLIGFHLVFLSLAWSSLALLPPLPVALGPAARHVSRPGLVFALGGALHTYALCVILLRYF